MSSTVIVTGDTAATENDPGWMFGRDPGNVTPISFNTAAHSIGDGSLQVLPITNAVPGDKFIGELFLDTTVGGLGTTSFDFRMGSGVTQYNQFYWNVYANFSVSDPNKYYDCRYDFVATSGSDTGFTTVSFDPSTVATAVTQRGSSPATCPSTLGGMGAGANVRAAVINVGDTAISDTGVSGYIDNVITTDTSVTTTYDLEAKTNLDVTVTGDTAVAENEPGWMFGRDPGNVTPIEFTTAAQSIGAGSLHVEPIGANASDKFIGELFLDSTVGGLGTTSFDFRMGSGVAQYGQFYWNVYANFAESDANKYYDCRYAFVASSGSDAAFTTLAFDKNTTATAVTTRGGPTPSPHTCPTTLAGMGAGANVRAAVINVGDTTTSDTGVSGYIDNVITNHNGTTTYDLEPATDSTVTVTGNTAAAYNSPGWMFNRDPSSATPFVFNTAAQVIGDGSLYVQPISATPSNKFVGELFLDSNVAQLGRQSFDFRMGAGVTQYDHFYWTVYANYPSSPATKFYDCRFHFVAASGSDAAFTAVPFTKNTVDAGVATSGTSPHACPTTLAGMGGAARVRAAVINVGDTSASDVGVAGYLDNVTSTVNGSETTFDFESDLTALSYTGATSGTNTNSVTLSATLTSAFHPGGVAGKSIAFTLGSQSAVGTTNASGVATASILLDQPAGSLTVDAAFAGGGAYPAALASAPFALSKAVTTLTVTNPGALQIGQVKGLQAKLVNASSANAPLAGRTISFQTCSPSAVCTTSSAVTNAAGVATASYTTPSPGGLYSLTVTSAADAKFLGSTATTSFSVFTTRTKLSLAVTSGKYGGAFHLEAAASSVSGAVVSPFAGRVIAFYRMPTPTETNVANGVLVGSAVTQANGHASVLFRMDTMPIKPVPGASFSFRAAYVGSLIFGPSQSTTNTAAVVKRGTTLTGTAIRIGGDASINLLLSKERLTYTRLNGPSTTVTVMAGTLAGQVVGLRWANAAGTVIGSFTGLTDANGRVIMTRAIPAGATKLRVAYNGNALYAAAPPGLPFAV